MTCHELKISPVYFDAVSNGVKDFEIRKNDRDFKVGDTLRLKEYDRDMVSVRLNEDCSVSSVTGGYTGRACDAAVTFILTFEDFPQGIKEGYCIMGIRTAGVSE